MRLGWIHFSIVILVFSLSCDESLPPRQDPTNLFKARVQASYYYSPFANVVLIQLIAVNDFDETLNDRIGIDGTIVVASNRDTSVHKTFQLFASNLIHGTYDPSTATLTIDPGDSVVIQVSWDFTDDAGDSLSTDFFHYVIDVTCRQRMITDLENFTIVGKTKLYASLGYAKSQIPFTIRQYDHFVGPHDCLPL